jgi:hypothetical protein
VTGLILFHFTSWLFLQRDAVCFTAELAERSDP